MPEYSKCSSGTSYPYPIQRDGKRLSIEEVLEALNAPAAVRGGEPSGWKCGVMAALDCFKSCPYDGGFDEEIGPIGCFLEEQHGCVCAGMHGAISGLQEPPTPPPAPQGEAVAWRCKSILPTSLGWIVVLKKPELREPEKWIVEPLFDHPTPPAMDGGLSRSDQEKALHTAWGKGVSTWNGIGDIIDALHASGFEIRKKP